MVPGMSATIYHNPACGTSRTVLAMIREAGIEPVVVEYLKTPLDVDALRELIGRMGVPVRAVLRERGTPYEELGLGEDRWTDAQLLEAIARHPVLLNRPIVVTPRGAKLCRPAETVKDLLPG